MSPKRGPWDSPRKNPGENTGCMSFKVVLIWCRQVQLGLVGWGLGFGYQKLYKETLKLNLGKLAFHRAV